MWSGILRLRCPFCVRSTWEWESHVPRVLLYVFGHRADTQALSSIASLPPSFSPFTQVASHWGKRWYRSLRGVAGPVHSLGLCMLHCACVPCCLYLFSLFYCWNCSCWNLQGSCQIDFLRKFCNSAFSHTISFSSWWFSPQNSSFSSLPEVLLRSGSITRFCKWLHVLQKPESSLLDRLNNLSGSPHFERIRLTLKCNWNVFWKMWPRFRERYIHFGIISLFATDRFLFISQLPKRFGRVKFGVS